MSAWGLRRAAAVSLVTVVTACGGTGGGATTPDSSTPGASSPASSSPTSSAAAASPSTASPPAATGSSVGDPVVLVISVDGLRPDALHRLGREDAPNLWRIVDAGASTLNARTAVEMSVTLPNHSGMLTGRRVDAARGGHGYTDNDDGAGLVAEPDGDPVASVFDVVEEAGGSTALFASKESFALFDRSWPAIAEYVYGPHDEVLAQRAADHLEDRGHDFTFLHLAGPDETGHTYGWMSPEYLEAVEKVDDILGVLWEDLVEDPQLHDRLTLVVTADHGGEGTDHYVRDPQNYTIPFLVVGPGVPAGSDLYALNPGRADPGERQPAYEEPRQPVRNGDVANLVTSLLGLGPVPGSEFGRDDPLNVHG